MKEIGATDLLEILETPTFIQIFNDNTKVKADPSVIPTCSIYRGDLTHLFALNEKRAGIYFAINTFIGSRKKVNLASLRAIYGDLDVSKDGQGTPPEEIIEKKDLLREALLGLPVKPSIIIDTKNGLQPLWLLGALAPTPENVSRYAKIMQGVVEWSVQWGSLGDNVKDVTRVLRLPGFNHMKSKPYPITAIDYEGKKATLASLEKQFPIFDMKLIDTDNKKTNEFKGIDILEDIDIKAVAVAALNEAGINDARFLEDGRLFAEGRVTGAFQGKEGDFQFIASSSHNIQFGNKTTFVAKTLGKSNKEAFKWIIEHFDLKSQEEKDKIKRESFLSSKESSWDEVVKIFEERFYEPDMVSLKVVLSAVLSFYSSAKPVWLFVVAPPSCMKTEFISPLSFLQDIYPVSSLTPATLLSGYDDKTNKKLEPSLLMKLGSAILTFKDFTSILSMKAEARLEIMGQLREVYDGEVNKDFGTGKRISWKGKIGFVSGVTEKIDETSAIKSQLGERFINYRPLVPNGISSAVRAITLQNSAIEADQKIGETIRFFFNSIDKKKEIKLSTKMITKIANLAQIVVKIRAGIPIDSYSGDLLYVANEEGPARLASQLSTLAKGLAIINGRDSVTDEEYKIVLKCGLDSSTKQRLMIVNHLLENDPEPTSSYSVGKKIGIKSERAKNLLSNLARIKLVKRVENDYFDPNDQFEKKTSTWMVSDEIKEMIKKSFVDDVIEDQYNGFMIKYYKENK